VTNQGKVVLTSWVRENIIQTRGVILVNPRSQRLRNNVFIVLQISRIRNREACHALDKSGEDTVARDSSWEQ